MHAFIGTPCWNWCFGNRIVLSTVAMFCYYLLLGVCILNWLSESVNFKHWNSVEKSRGNFDSTRFQGQCVLIHSRSLLFHLLITIACATVGFERQRNCWGYVPRKKIKCSFAYQESDLARQKNNTFWSYAESERVRFSNPVARESLLKHQKKTSHPSE